MVDPIPRVYDGKEWSDIILPSKEEEERNKINESIQNNNNNNNNFGIGGAIGGILNRLVPRGEDGAGGDDNYKPVPPIVDGDGKIFISIVNYRDGPRCGQTIVDIFNEAKDPDNIIVGIIEQNSNDDIFCLEAYCSEMGIELYNNNNNPEEETTETTITKDVINEIQLKKCPRYNQIRTKIIHYTNAKGPTYARSLINNLIGNEEYCLQIDSHMEFTNNYDIKLKNEWYSIQNEYSIISTIPSGIRDKHINDNNDTTNNVIVPRQCTIEFKDNNIPGYKVMIDGKVENIQKPLLSHSWSSSYSFSKCHLYETTPYDINLKYILGAEQFAIYSRFWTRGYDVYTPTNNYIYHKYTKTPHLYEWLNTPNGQNNNNENIEYIKLQSLDRIKTYLQLLDKEEQDVALTNNFGIYGLGKRRTIEQLATFIGFDWNTKQKLPNTNHKSCADDKWVPYDTTISPMENLYNNQPKNQLELQPIYPLRTKFTFIGKNYNTNRRRISSIGSSNTNNIRGGTTSNGKPPLPLSIQQQQPSPFPSFYILFPLWILGLLLWYIVFGKINNGGGSSRISTSTNTTTTNTTTTTTNNNNNNNAPTRKQTNSLKDK